MPYKIRHDGDPPKAWCVYNVGSGERKGCSATEAEAKKFKQVLDMREHGVPPKKKEGEVEEVPTEEKEVTPIEEVPVSPMILSAEYIQRLDSMDQEIDKVKSVEIEGGTQVQIPSTPDLQEDLQVLTAIAVAEVAVEEKASTDLAALDLAKKTTEEPVSTETHPIDSYSVEDLEALLEKAREREEIQRKEQKEPGMGEQILIYLKSIYDTVCGRPPSISPLFITKEQSDGSFRWVFVSSTAFRDREAEIVSMESVSKSIDRADETKHYGPLHFWHTPVELGTCDFQAQSGIALVESGLWGSTPQAKAAMNSTLQSPDNWGVSIGFLPLASQEGVVIKGAKVNRLWTDLQIVERSILPSSEAASLFTQITTRGKTMEQKKRDALVELLGGDLDLVEKVLSATKEINEKASEPDAVFKEANETQPEGEKAQSAPTEEMKETEEDTSEPDILIAIKALGERVESLTAEVKAVQESSGAPRIALQRPTVSAEPSDETETKDTEDSTPRVVKAIGAHIGGQR